jgi:tetratricopeptide (TPR) repeat protein
VAHQAISIVRREQGLLEEAVAHGSVALRLARRVGMARTSDVLATLGLTLILAGHPRRGMKRMSEAVSLAPAEVRASVLYRRARANGLLGDYVAALSDVRGAIKLSHRQGDALWEGRAHVLRGDTLTALARFNEADSALETAFSILTAHGSEYEANVAIHNRGNVAFRRGDLVGALRLLEQAGERYQRHGMDRPPLTIDHVEVLLTAGLVAEARSLVEDSLLHSHLLPLHRAEMLMVSAQAALMDRAPSIATEQALEAQTLFTAHGRSFMAHRAQLLLLQARYAAERKADVPDRDELLGILRAGRRLEQDMRAAGSPVLPVLLLLIAQAEAQLKRSASSSKALEEVAMTRSHGSPLERSAGWLAAALLADLRGDRRALLHACLRGLDAVDEHRALMGDLELRALASRHGTELATLAFRSKVAEEDGRGMLWWIERWRATALNATPVRPTMDAELERQLAALRNVTRRLETMPEADPLAPFLRQERARRETAVRSAYRRRGGRGTVGPRFDLQRVFDVLGDRQLVELISDDDVLYSLVVRDGRVHRRPILSMLEARREAQFARFALRRAAYGRVPDLDAVGRRLQRALLGETKDLAGARRTVVVPPPPLLTAPWGLLPLLHDHVFTVVPSATMWATVATEAAAQGHIALVTGPDLSTGEAEVTALSPLHEGARSIAGDAATVAVALQLLDGARLAHIAAHGTFRADAPLFSSLKLADGPLTVHDLDRLERPPVEMVLSACDSGNAAPIGAYEALGLVSSLLAMGTATVLASVVPVNDRATIAVMRDVHDVVGRGGSLAEGWLAARRAAAHDPLTQATAAAFTAWGA